MVLKRFRVRGRKGEARSRYRRKCKHMAAVKSRREALQPRKTLGILESFEREEACSLGMDVHLFFPINFELFDYVMVCGSTLMVLDTVKL